MANKALTKVIDRLRSLAALQKCGQCLDRELLSRFVHDQDETAFTALVERHGGMVLKVCRRVLQHQHDAEDACQATFLILVRKASSIRKVNSLASWLHGVAFRVALKLRAHTARSHRALKDLQHSPPLEEAGFTLNELESALDEELERLPEKYRNPLILCCLQGKTRDEAAQQLGCPASTLKGRLELGRKLLQQRLARRGLALSTALLVTALAQSASAALPATLATITVKNAMALAGGQGIAGLVSEPVAYLMQGFLRTLLVQKMAMGLAACLLVGFVASGGWYAFQQLDFRAASAGHAGASSTLPVEKPPVQQVATSLPDEKPAHPLTDPEPANNVANLVQRGSQLVMNVAKCGDCHTPRNAQGELDLSRHLQGATTGPNVNKGGRESDDKAPDITMSGRAGKWTEDRMVLFLTKGENEHDRLAVHRLPPEDARVVAVYLRSLPGKQ